MSFQERFKASPLRQKWRQELSKKNSTSKRRRNRRNKTNSTNEDEDMMLDFDQLQDIPEGTTVLQRAIMYQMEQKLPKLGNDKQKKKKRKPAPDRDPDGDPDSDASSSSSTSGRKRGRSRTRKEAEAITVPSLPKPGQFRAWKYGVSKCERRFASP